MRWHADEVFYPLIGWERPDGRRRFRRGGLFVPKKNTKSSLTSWLTTFFMTADFPLTDVFGAATDRNQAKIIFNMVARSIQKSPALSQILTVVKSSSTIVNKEHGNEYRCLSSDSWRQEGLNGKVVIDEIHAHRSHDLIDALVYANRATPNGLVLGISTAGSERSGVGWQWWQDCEIVSREPEAIPNFYGKIYAAKDTDDFSDPALWRRVNPCMGVTFPEDEFADDYKDALTDPRKMARFLRYSLNVWCAADSRWIPPEEWAACYIAEMLLADKAECWIGVDLAWSEDTTAVVAIFPDKKGGFDVWCRIYLPEELVDDRERRDRCEYRQWAEDGFVILTPGAVTDYDFIRRDIEALNRKYTIKMIAVDPHNATHITNQLDGAGLPVKKYPQSYAGMNAPCRLIETLISKRAIRHTSPALSRQMGNVAVKMNAEGLIRPLKPKLNSPLRVDGPLAMCMAFGAWSETGQEPEKPKVRPRIHAL
jgi:phage terminase large subunit-like protein